MNKEKIKDNEVIIIGGDHHNTLALIRCFGEERINYKLLIHSSYIKDKKKLMIFHSRYGKKLELIEENEQLIINYLMENKNDKYKQVIVPGSDLAEYTIDKNYNLLEKYYYIPGFKHQPGKVCKMMDKFEQKKWADSNNILMAKSWVINLEKENTIPKDIIFPCIAKPVVSAKGKKGDIRICKNELELKNAYDNYILDSCPKILVQEFIKKDFELLAMGLICDDGYAGYGGIERKLRETIPGGGGSTALGQFIEDENISNIVNNVLEKLYLDGYRGLYDIEFFECGERIYLNEINFRHSGSGFALIKNGVKAPYLYYKACCNEKIDPKKLKHSKGYFFCDIGELNLLLKYKTINILKFTKDFLKSYSHAIFDIKDISVICYCIKKFFSKRR